MAVGKDIISAFAGSADFYSFPNLYHESETQTQKSVKSEKAIALELLYGQVRTLREDGNIEPEKLDTIFRTIKEEHPGDWLLALELLELSKDDTLSIKIRSYLEELSQSRPSLNKLINDGLDLITS